MTCRSGLRIDLSMMTVVLLLTLLSVAPARALVNGPSRSIDVVPPPQEGEVFKHQEAGVQFVVPAGWKSNPDAEQLTVAAPDNSLRMVFWVPKEDTFEQAVSALVDELAKVIKDQKLEREPADTTVNGMPAYTIAGTGVVDGKKVQWAVDLIQARKPFIVLSFADPGAWEKHSAAYQSLVKSIKKIG